MSNVVKTTSNIYYDIKGFPKRSPTPIEDLYREGQVNQLLGGTIVELYTRVGGENSKGTLEYEIRFLKKIRIEDITTPKLLSEANYDPNSLLQIVKTKIDRKIEHLKSDGAE